MWIKKCKECGKRIQPSRKTGMCRPCYKRKWHKENNKNARLRFIKASSLDRVEVKEN